MNHAFLAAGVLAFLIGLVHSVFGERMIFRRLRTQGLVPTQGGSALREPHVRILWASWHALTMFGWGVAAALVWLAMPAQAALAASPLVLAIVAAMAASALLVLGARGAVTRAGSG